MGKYGNKAEVKQPPKIMTSEEKAHLMAREQAEQIFNQIEEGRMKVSPKKTKIKSPPKTEGEESMEAIE